MADPTPAPGGTSTSSMPSFWARRTAWTGAAPPKAIMVNPDRSLPFSTAWTRAALAMFSSTISETPTAAAPTSSESGPPTASPMARAAASGFRSIPAAPKVSGVSRPSTRSASVTVGRDPPRP